MIPTINSNPEIREGGKDGTHDVVSNATPLPGDPATLEHTALIKTKKQLGSEANEKRDTVQTVHNNSSALPQP